MQNTDKLIITKLMSNDYKCWRKTKQEIRTRGLGDIGGRMVKKKCPFDKDDTWLELCWTESGPCKCQGRSFQMDGTVQCKGPGVGVCFGFFLWISHEATGWRRTRKGVGTCGPCSELWIFTLSELWLWRWGAGGTWSRGGHKLIEYLKRFTLVTIWKIDTDRQEKIKQGDPLGGYAASRTCWLPARPRKHQSQEPGGAPTDCQKHEPSYAAIPDPLDARREGPASPSWLPPRLAGRPDQINTEYTGI